MADIIHLLPDVVANQIAAGEVVQRPASALKELMENSIDAGATAITISIREAGKSLIQVTDNGCGMSERDARMCFERHATSKIKTSDDLLKIRTLGFRGEALASIASIAQVELKTKRIEDEIGTQIIVEGADLKSQSPVQCPDGTTVMVRNLFYNVPARRNFLKSNTIELKHLLEEFFRVALVTPDVSFTFYNQEKILYKLTPGNLKQRILNLFGNSFAQRLIPVEQQSNLVVINGFIGKPEFAKKTRGEQYFFTNGRFMRSPYLNHAVDQAFRELIPGDSYPLYFIYLDVDPQTIDVNIHPTKTEINFQDSKHIYAILHAAVRQSVGKFNLAPSLDFDTESSLNIPDAPKGYQPKQPEIQVNPNYNPFEKKINPQPSFHFPPFSSETKQKWEELFQHSSREIPPDPLSQFPSLPEPENSPSLTASETEKKNGVQVQNSFILTHTRAGIVIIDQQNAHERILYERFSQAREHYEFASQPLMFPQTVNLSPDKAALFLEWQENFKDMGFEISDFGNGSFVIHAFPFQVRTTDAITLFETILEGISQPSPEKSVRQKLTLARALAKKLAVKRGKALHQTETDAIIENLFACNAPEFSPDGKPTMVVISYEELYRKLKIYG